MKRLQKTTYAFCFGIAVFIQPNLTAADSLSRTPLSEYSNEEIIAEYHRRIDEFTKSNINPFVNEMITTVEKSGSRGVVENENLSLERMLSLESEAMKFGLPFAEVGHLDMMTMVGGLKIVKNDLTSVCDGYAMIREAAVEGFLGAVLTLTSLHMRMHDVDLESERLMYLWSREGFHRSPDMFTDNFKFTSDLIPQDRRVEYEKAWVDWSPEESPEKISEECP